MRKHFFLNRYCLALWLAAIIFPVACASYSQRLPLAEELLEKGAGDADRNLESMRRGRALAVTECTSCHRFFWPDEYPPEAWRGIISTMATRLSLTERQAEDVQQYFMSASRATRLSSEDSK